MSGELTREVLRNAWRNIYVALDRPQSRPVHYYCHPIELPFWRVFYSGRPYDIDKWIQLKSECIRKWRMNHRVPKWTIAYLNEQYTRKLAEI